jgi:hypothetical protein
MLGALVFLYGFLFIPPFLPRELTGDNMHFLLSGQRMYEGDTMYRDFFEFVTPGTALVNFFLFKLFGLRLWIPSLLCLLLGLGLVWSGVAIAKKLMRPGVALLPSAIFLCGLYWKGLDPTHHWYSLLMAMAALAILMERRTPARIAAAGIFCGLSSCFTQTRGLVVAAGFGIYLWWEARRRREGWRELLKKEAWLIASFLAALTAVNAYFVWKAGPSRFFWCTVVYLFKYVPKQADFNTLLALKQCLPKIEWLSWRHPSYLVEWPLVWAVSPFVYVLFFVTFWRKSGEKPTEFWERPMLLALAGSFLLLSILPGPSQSRMATSALPGIILLVWFVDSWPRPARSLLTVFAVGALLVALHTVAMRQPLENRTLTTAQGRTVLADQNTYQEYTWIQQHTRPREFFYEPAYPDQYFILNLRNPTPLPFMTNCGYTTTGQVTEAIRGLEQHPVRYIIWTPSLEVLPAWEDPSDAHLGPLYDYIRSHYQQIKVFENSDQVWENKE